MENRADLSNIRKELKSEERKLFFRRFRSNKLLLTGTIIILFLLLVTIVGPFLVTQDPYEMVVQDRLEGPSSEHLLGTDEFGRDLWTRVRRGTQVSLIIAVVAAILDLLIGVIYGSISGFYGGKLDDFMQRVIEVLVGIPNLILIILFILIFKPGIVTIILAMVITGWVNMARIVRGQILQLKGQEFILASRALGATNRQLIWKHLIPNTLGPIIVTLMFTIPTAIFFEAFLSFIGIGIQPPLASLGTLIEDGYQDMRFFSYKLIFPAVLISAIMISFNVLGDGLRDALDPKMRK